MPYNGVTNVKVSKRRQLCPSQIQGLTVFSSLAFILPKWPKPQGQGQGQGFVAESNLS